MNENYLRELDKFHPHPQSYCSNVIEILCSVNHRVRGDPGSRYRPDAPVVVDLIDTLAKLEASVTPSRVAGKFSCGTIVWKR